MTITVIKNAEFVVAWDAQAGRHTYLKDADVAFEGNAIVHVGKDYRPPQGKAVQILSGQGRMVMPGLVNIHSHPASEPLNKGYTDEIGSPGLYNSGLYEIMPLMRGDAEAAPHCLNQSLGELLLSGVTTLVDMSGTHETWIDVAADSGMRACIAPLFKSARWFTRNGHLVEYEWDEEAGMRSMQAALDLVDKACAHESGRLFGMVTPAQVDTCTPELIQTSHQEARRRNLSWQIHAAQSVPEFHEMTRRHGVTPIQWLHSLGVLQPRSIVGHGIFLDDHPRAAWHTRSDLAILAETQTTVAHCPTIFMRRGMALRDFGRYRRAGVNMGIGTDSYPHNMLDEMRHVGYLARLMADDPRTTTTAEIFDAATIGAAKALGRDDIGRLAPGAKADMVLVDLRHPMMSPYRDPVRSLIFAAGDRAVHTVFVDGRKVVEDGEVLTIDRAAAAAGVQAAQQRAIAKFPSLDLVAQRSIAEVAPLTFPLG
ncbi:N-ethylammeline chlorohydrolase [Bordetella trematum]|uniref:amidohydrolase family protein n=1 Tax=Bordetella trematum TaxID=123899 RepID=UPI0014046A8E|nr:amidohydrolase family protein [Bordetella trematum]QIM72226.1 N-ethylammeline chlorohydrolase [Bordetella trematum]